MPAMAVQCGLSVHSSIFLVEAVDVAGIWLYALHFLVDISLENTPEVVAMEMKAEQIQWTCES